MAHSSPPLDYSPDAITKRTADLLSLAAGRSANDPLEIDGETKPIAIWLWERVHGTRLPAGYHIRYSGEPDAPLDVRAVFAVSKQDARRRRAASENGSWRQLPSGLWEKRCAGPCSRWRCETSPDWTRTPTGKHNGPRCRACHAAHMRERREAAVREVRMGYRVWLLSPHDGRPYSISRPSGGVGLTACELPKLLGVSIAFDRLHGRSAASTLPQLERMKVMLGTDPTGSPFADDNVGRACRDLAAWARLHPEGTWRVQLIDRVVRVKANYPYALDRLDVD